MQHAELLAFYLAIFESACADIGAPRHRILFSCYEKKLTSSQLIRELVCASAIRQSDTLRRAEGQFHVEKKRTYPFKLDDRETPMKKEDPNADPRIAKKFSGDRSWSLVAVAVLWALYAFVFYEVKDYLGDPQVVWTLAVFGGLVLLFNTAAILAMVAHLSEEREDIYGLDLHYIDLAKKKSYS